MTGERGPWGSIRGDQSPWRDCVVRLHEFQGEHPDVEFTSPVMGRYGQYMAFVPRGAIPGESREIIVKSPDLCGLMDQLDDLFNASGSVKLS